MITADGPWLYVKECVFLKSFTPKWILTFTSRRFLFLCCFMKLDAGLHYVPPAAVYIFLYILSQSQQSGQSGHVHGYFTRTVVYKSTKIYVYYLLSSLGLKFEILTQIRMTFMLVQKHFCIS